MKSKVDEVRYPSTAGNKRSHKINTVNHQNVQRVSGKNGYAGVVGKSQSKKTLVETLDLNGYNGYEFDENEYQSPIYQSTRKRNLKIKALRIPDRSPQKYAIIHKNSIPSIAGKLSDNHSHKSSLELEQVIQDLSHHNQGILQEARSTVKGFQNYIEELLALNAQMEARIFEYEQAYSLLQQEKMRIEQQLINANGLKQSRQKSQRQLKKAVKNNITMYEKQKKNQQLIKKIKKQINEKNLQLSSKDEQIKLLQQCLQGKETVIKKMSGFNNQLCLELMELKNSQRNYIQNDQTQDQVQYQLSKKQKQIYSLKEVNGMLRKQIFDFMRENQIVLMNLVRNLQREREKNSVLEDELIRQMENRNSNKESFAWKQVQKNNSGKILKQRSSTPKSNFQSFAKSSHHKPEKRSQSNKKARMVTDPDKFIEEYLLTELSSPKQFLRMIDRIIKLFGEKILKNEENYQIQMELKSIDETIQSINKKKNYPLQITELNFPWFNEQDEQLIRHQKKDSMEKIEQRNDFIIKRINNFRTTLEKVGKIQPFSPISIMNYKKQKKADEEKVDETSKNYDPNILKKFGNFDSYGEYTFELNGFSKD